MKTIYNRLHPRIMASINADKQKHPYTTRALKLKLKCTDDWDNLSISDIRAVLIHSNMSLIDVKLEDLLWGDRFLTE